MSQFETWPEGALPLPSQAYSVDRNFATIRTEMDSGRIRQRNRFTKSTDFANVVFELDRKKLSIFEAFWFYKLNNGIDWFMMRLPTADGTSLTETKVRFSGDFTKTHRPFENWDISVLLEIDDSPIISENELDLEIHFDGDLQNLVDANDQLENIFPADWEYNP